MRLIRGALRALSPLLVYFGVSFLVELGSKLLVRLGMRCGWILENGFLDRNHGVLLMILISAAAVPLLYRMYVRDGARVRTSFRRNGGGLETGKLLLLAAAFSAGLNMLLNLSPLMKLFPAIQEANKTLYGGNPLLSCAYVLVIAPFTEELLFRGLVFQRLRSFLSFAPAAACSAFLFGLIHGNMIQFLYALLLGLVLAYICEKRGSLRDSFLFHMTANLCGGCGPVIVMLAQALGAPALAWVTAALLLFLSVRLLRRL